MASARQLAGIISALILLCGSAAQAQPAQGTATIRGVVLDRADGTAIADVSVQVQDSTQSVNANTDLQHRVENRLHFENSDYAGRRAFARRAW